MTKTGKRAAALFLLLCAAWYYHATVTEVIRMLKPGTDFTAYYEASRNVLGGRSPFYTLGYIYPPFLAFAITPIAAMPPMPAQYAWFAFSQACLLAAAWLTWRTAGRDWFAACSVALVWAVGGAAADNLAWGQPGSELALVVAIALTQRGWRAATALATGVAIKLVPGLLAALFLLRRQWRPLLIFAVTAATLVILPFLVVSCCLDGPQSPGASDTWSGTPDPMSWGVPSVLLRALDPPVKGGALPRDWRTQLPYLRLPAWERWSAIGAGVAVVLLGIAVLAVAMPKDSSPEGDSFLMAALVSLSLAASPVCWPHYQELQYPGIALLLCHAVRSRRWLLAAVAIALGALLFQLPMAGITAYYNKYGSLTASLPALYFWTSVTPIASLCLFGIFVRTARDPVRQPQ